MSNLNVTESAGDTTRLKLAARFAQLIDPAEKECCLGNFFWWSILVFMATVVVDEWLILRHLVPSDFFDPFRTRSGLIAIALHLTVVAICLLELRPPAIKLAIRQGAATL